ncbi:MAG: hypothetical protein AAB853_05045 [Patescibacteria group bacterium]
MDSGQWTVDNGAVESEKIPCSVLILTRLAGRTLERCLRPLAPFGEILVHDANSTDDTIAIAKKSGARVLRQYETDEPNVRVKDFTKIRLKQRANAAFDWVLYIDADEIMPPALVTEVEEILRDAHIKTIVKFPRLPIVDGNIIRHGAFWPEIVPRLHHRKGGCTLQAGKTVHEKYVYDGSFTEIITKAPLYVPMEPLADLLQKDDTYIALEIAKLRQKGFMTLSHYVRWFLFREPMIAAHIGLRVVLCRIRHAARDSLPLRYEFRALRYHAKLFFAFTAFFSTQKFRGRRSAMD